VTFARVLGYLDGRAAVARLLAENEAPGREELREAFLDAAWARLVVQGDMDPADFQTITCELVEQGWPFRGRGR
jgi:hypothetical protein